MKTIAKSGGMPTGAAEPWAIRWPNRQVHRHLGETRPSRLCVVRGACFAVVDR
jgi:hypothetical protein